jgi:phosphatidylglycerophosphate synthase
MESSVFASAKRDLSSVLAPAERRALVWMAERMPAWVTSDHLTVLGLGAMAMTGLSYWLARYWPPALLLAAAWLAVNWFGDSLDGTLARVRGCQRPRYGFYVDHVIDAAGTLCLVGGMGLSGYMSPMVALGLLVAYYLLSIDIYLATYCRGTFRMSYWGFGATELRVVIAIGNIVALLKPYTSVLGSRYLLFDVGAVVAIVGLVVTFVISVALNTRALFLAEPLPAPRARLASDRPSGT